MNELNKTFNFDNRALRAVSIDGEPWLRATDVCDALEFGDARQALESHVDGDDVQKMDTIDSLGRTQQASYINESGLYSLILGSRKLEAKRFQKWVTSEVLPAIRKTGSYNGAGFKYPERMSEALRLAADLSDQKALVEAKLPIEALRRAP